MAKKGYVYIAANLNNSVLNTEVTNFLRNQLILKTMVKYAPSSHFTWQAEN